MSSGSRTRECPGSRCVSRWFSGGCSGTWAAAAKASLFGLGRGRMAVDGFRSRIKLPPCRTTGRCPRRVDILRPSAAQRLTGTNRCSVSGNSNFEPYTVRKRGRKVRNSHPALNGLSPELFVPIGSCPSCVHAGRQNRPSLQGEVSLCGVHWRNRLAKTQSYRYGCVTGLGRQGVVPEQERPRSGGLLQPSKATKWRS